MLRRFAAPLWSVLVILFIILSAVPLVFLRTVTLSALGQEIEADRATVSLGVLDQSRKYLGLLLSELDAFSDTLAASPELLASFERGVESVGSYLIQQGKSTGTAGHLVVFPGPNSPPILGCCERYETASLAESEAFYETESARLLAENSSRVIWTGRSPLSTVNEPGLWSIRVLPSPGDDAWFLAVSLSPELLGDFLSGVRTAVESEVVFVTPDNYLLPPETTDFFDQPFASRALSRTLQGQFISFGGLRNHARGAEEVLVQVYSDPAVFYNLVAITPVRELTSGIGRVTNTLSAVVLIAIAVVGLAGTVLILMITRRIRGILSDLDQVAAGNFDLGVSTRSLQIREFDRISEGVRAMATTLSESRRRLEDLNDRLETIVADRTVELEQSLQDLRRTQENLVQSEKMAALGRLVSGFSQQINGPIGVSITAITHMHTLAEQLLEKGEGASLTASDFSEGLRRVIEASDIVLRNLRNATKVSTAMEGIIAGDEAGERRGIDLETYLSEIVTALSPRIRRPAFTLKFACDPLPPANINPTCLYQILVNLVENSLQHGFEGKDMGTIWIRAGMLDRDIRIVYEDDGVGMPPEHLARLYEPLFSTKRDSAGAGIGMNVVYNLVTTDLGGSIESTSVPDQGTRFEIRFPPNPGKGGRP
jgi:signal transduction histidine kinase